jgi:hypothetical protein
MAAVLLRKNLDKSWTKLPPVLHGQIKQVLLQRLVTETEGLIQHAIAEVIRWVYCQAQWLSQ